MPPSEEPTSGRRRRWFAAGTGALLALAGAVALQTTTASTAQAATALPCVTYGNAGTPCVAAFSSVRAVVGGYNGPLYRVTRASDGTSRDIGLLSAGGYVNAASQDSFCAGTSCSIGTIYDQTTNHNDLAVAPAGDAGPANSPANATALPVTVAGHEAYGIYLPPHVAYRRSADITKGTARDQSPESMYEVASGTNINNGCCSDFGNVERLEKDDDTGTMDALNLSLLNAPGASGHGPWVQADLENGVFQGGTAVYSNNQGNPSKFVTALLKNNGVNQFALKGGNAQSGALSKWYEGPEPASNSKYGYSPMRLEGSIVLGAGGDNSNRGTQSFFEGVMTSGYSSDTADNDVQSNVVAAGYTGVSTGGGPGGMIVGPGGKCVDVDGDDTGGNLARVQLYDCRALAADQHWNASSINRGTLDTLGRCLDINGNGTANGTHLELYDCNGAGGQQWIPQADGSLKNPQSGRCLDDPSGNTANGTPLQIYDCNGNAAQKFSFVQGTPIHLPGGKCVDVAGDDTGGNLAVVQVYACLTVRTGQPLALDQQWTWNSDQTIRTLGRCLDLDGNGTANGTHLELYDCNGVGGQKWVPQPNGSLKNPQSGRCLDDPSGNTADKTPLQLYDCNNQSPQVFTFNG